MPKTDPEFNIVLPTTVCGWYTLCEDTTIPEAFFRKYNYALCWDTICQNPSISEAFFEKYIHRVDWESICQNPSLSESFFERHIDRLSSKIYFEILRTNKSISKEFIEKYE